ncbi:MAG TPA: valine--tRNA ligase [bacterium]|nr:valine--tRNA ligase [bacterium]
MELEKSRSNEENNEDQDALSKRFDPSSYEKKWAEYWVENGIFANHPVEGKDSFCIVIPPPNVTGKLHMGHALNTTLQDVLLRFNHMRGRDAMWIPGMDHAGIATQNVVEKRLRQEGTNRHELGREKFVQRVWEWKDEYHDNIKNQLEKMGAAVDWTRERFTLDEQCSLAVRTSFKQLFDEGLIYQDYRIINWCPNDSCRTALSDVEVEYEEEDGFFYHINYPVVGEDICLEIATTRPETMLGDSAVAVHPDDERYLNLHGKKVLLPLVNREIPIITDPYVDMEFGTGALKITPAHDPNDFEIGRKHELPEYIMLTEEGRITEDYEAYAGMDRFDARKKIVEDLEAAGFFIKKVPHNHSVGHCYRCGSTVEPYLSKQWFVDMKPLAKPAIEAVKEGRTRFVPEKWAKVYFDWLENIRDWCISRQLWWGHRIPVWDCEECGTRSCEIEDVKVCPNCGSEKVHQHEDVLDTWFSSALWPLSTLGWPVDNADLEKFYPTSVLVTGFDIIFFWVARMMFFGLKFGEEIPFHDVFIHGIVRDEYGKKMSKSTGNAMDPLEVVDEFGADALRFTFLYMGSMGQDVNVSQDRFRTGANFCNKLWNTSRFILMMAPDAPSMKLEELDRDKMEIQDRWILTGAAKLIKDVARLIENYDLNEAAQSIYRFMWHDFCDWYLELAKRPLREDDPEAAEYTKVILHTILGWTLQLLHPIIPFITEEIWSKLPGTDGCIADSGYPESGWEEDGDAVQHIEFLQELVRGIRDIRANLNMPPRKKVNVVMLSHESGGRKKAMIEEGGQFIQDMAGVDGFTVDEPLEEGTKAMSAIANGVEIFIPVEAEKIEEEIARLKKMEKTVQEDMQRAERKLGDEKFVNNAPEQVVEKERNKLAEFQSDLKKIRERLSALGPA